MVDVQVQTRWRVGLLMGKAVWVSGVRAISWDGPDDKRADDATRGKERVRDTEHGTASMGVV
jgi:tagatose-1,6-bisphosphate aldolase